jgi:hypothetical protein
MSDEIFNLPIIARHILTWTSIFAKDIATPIEAIGNVVDKLFTSDKERLDKQALMARLAAEPHLLQAEINRVEASNRSLFVAGWRPFIGWICGAALAYNFVIRDVVIGTYAMLGQPIDMPDMAIDQLTTLLYSLLGLGGLRTFEKLKGRTK